MNLVEAARKMTLSEQTAVWPQRLLLVLWTAVAAAFLAIFVTDLWLSYPMLAAPCTGEGCHYQAIGPTEAAVLAQWGLPVTAYALYILGISVLPVILFTALAVLMLNRLYPQKEGMFYSLTLIVIPVVAISSFDVVADAFPQLTIPIQLVVVVGHLLLMSLFLVFPRSRFEPRWTAVLPIFSVFFGLYPLFYAEEMRLPISQPYFLLLLLVLAVIFYRYRHLFDESERRQTRLAILGIFIFFIGVPIWSYTFEIAAPAPGQARLLTTMIGWTLCIITTIALPATLFVAILRDRLWDMAIILNRTLVYGGLTVGVTAVYLLMIGGLGLLAAGQQWRLIGVVLATAVTAILLKPVKTSLQTHVNRLIPPTPKDVPTPTEHAHHPAIPHRRGLVAGLLLLALAVQAALAWLTAVGCYRFSDYGLVGLFVSAGSGLLFTTVGGLILYYRPDNRIGWLCLWTGIGLPALAVIELYLHCGLAGQLAAPGSAYLAWFTYSYGVVLIILPMFILLPMLYPNGHFLSPRWRNLTIGGLLIIAIASIGTGLLPDFGQINAFGGGWAITNPFGVTGLPTWWYATFRAMLLLAVLFVSVAGIASMGLRLKRSVGDERQQMKWLVYFMATAVIVQLLVFELPGTLFYPELFQTIWYELTILIVFWGYPLIIGIAVFKYRLYAIDLVINRTLVYGSLTLIAISIYALMIGLLSLLFHTSGNLVISLVATGFIAVLFQPLHQRLQRGVNRLMYGERDDPYKVLSQLGRQLGETAVPGQTLPAITTTICHTLKLPYAAIQLTTPDGGRQTVAVSGQPTTVSEEWPLLHQRELVGWLIVAPRSTQEQFTSQECQLLTDIAGQTGAVAYAVRLTTALQHSREKLVLAREEERRRLRRDLHDELGPVIASQGLKLAAARELLHTDPNTAVRLLDDVLAKNQNTVAEVRRLVYNLRPPTLDELGLVGAICEYVQNSASTDLKVTISAPDSLPPLSAAVEAAAYRIVAEAFTNVLRHAAAHHCWIELKVEEIGKKHISNHQSLFLLIKDDGRGLPANGRAGVGLLSMRERAEEVGGSCEIVSGESGVRVTAVLPISTDN
ncbi:MAG: hypothetical protein KF770_01880 [Anaerolineae bacterium]|nr:hypothetical protein [Anaerolineae bacterium]